MNLMEIKFALNSLDDYSFLYDKKCPKDDKGNKKFRSDLILLGVGGSHAYGMDTDTSDLDIRGVATNSPKDIIINNLFEQQIDSNTDTVIYSFDKIVNLLTNCNPNTIEILGLKPEHYLYINPLGWQLLDNSGLFLSRKAANSFGGYATSQLHRLKNRASVTYNEDDMQKHILNVLTYASDLIRDSYPDMGENAIKLYIDKSTSEDMSTEVFVDMNITHYPLRTYNSFMNQLVEIAKTYSKLGQRNSNAIEHNKLGKHMAHLIRLYYMCFDILEKQKIITYRTTEHDLLMDLRNGKYLDENSHPVNEFYEMVNDLEKRLEYAKGNTSLPDKPNMERITDFIYSINNQVLAQGYLDELRHKNSCRY